MPTVEKEDDALDVTARLNFRAGRHRADGTRGVVEVRLLAGQSMRPSVIWRTFQMLADTTPSWTRIRDARREEARSGLSKAAFFDKYGFVLLEAPTQMTETNWHHQATTTTKYAAEAEAVLRTLLSLADDTTVAVAGDGAVVRGGPKGQGYARGVHNDMGTTVDEYNCMLEALAIEARLPHAPQQRYRVLNLWRPILPMQRPVVDDALALCAKFSVAEADVCRTDLYGVTPTGRPQAQVSLAPNPAQQWFYYPSMTTNEVLVFSQFDTGRPNKTTTSADSAWSFPVVAHSSFSVPGAKPTEPRVSAELRLTVTGD